MVYIKHLEHKDSVQFLLLYWSQCGETNMAYLLQDS